MPIVSVVGGQWGDEGKGKIVDHLSSTMDLVARYQGGANAGHTVYMGDQKIILHQVPSGVLRSNCRCVIGNGMVLDPIGIVEELGILDQHGIQYQDRLFISYYTHIVTPIHKAIDKAQEKASNNRIGTTGRGIGPTYMDKYCRIGIRAHNLLDPAGLRVKVSRRLQLALDRGDLTAEQASGLTAELEPFYACAAKIQPYVSDVFTVLHAAFTEGQQVLIEGAQGTMLDVDHGTYPFVTSSNPSMGGVATGLGLPISAIDRRIGIFKAYCTRVGKGPFPTELTEGPGTRMQTIGGEFGATTGRPRRCGWFDGPIARYSAKLNGFNEIALTKLDVLDTFENIKVCVGYEIDGEMTRQVSEVLYRLESVQPVYDTLPGWNEPTAHIEHYDELPPRAKQYCQFLSELMDTPIKIISTGPERNQIIVRQ